MLTISDFGGIDLRDTHKNAFGTSRLVNFRTMPDGSLMRRGGTRLLASAQYNIRAVWVGVIWGQMRCIVLSGAYIYEMNMSSGTLTRLATATSSSGEAEFFCYRNTLYLVDGVGVHAVHESSISSPFGYVPLVGKNWHDSELGEIYQPRNLLNDHARFSYIISSRASAMLCIDDYASQVDALYINGEPVASNRYSVGTYSPYIYVSGLQEGDRVDLCITYKNSVSGLAKLNSATRAAVFGGITNSRPFLFGCSDRSLLYSSEYVSEADTKEAQRLYTDSDALYFPVGYEFSVGDGQHAISTVCRHFDRLLIFTEGGVWRADSASCGVESFPVMNVNLSVGVKSPLGAALLGNSPCAVGFDGIYRFTSNTDELDDCNAYSISDEIMPMLGRDFLESAAVYADTERRELLFSCASITDTVFVYSDITKKWTTFEGIFAQRFFDFDGRTAFINGKRIYVFDENSTDDAGSSFDACFEGNIADFGTHKKKHMSSLELCFDGESAECELCLDGDTDNVYTASFYSEAEHSRIKKRMSGRRFGYLSLKISGADDCKKIHSLTIMTR